MGTWTFLTNHGHVLLYVTAHPRSTTREIASAIGITERAAQRIIAELAEEGYIERHKEGRRNSYTVQADLPMRHPAQSDVSVGDFLDLLLVRARSHDRAALGVESRP